MPQQRKSRGSAYVRGAKSTPSAAKKLRPCLLARGHSVYLRKSYPKSRKSALLRCQSTTALQTNVALNNWTSFKKLGVNYTYAPGSYHTNMTLDLPVSIATTTARKSPETHRRPHEQDAL